MATQTKTAEDARLQAFINRVSAAEKEKKAAMSKTRTINLCPYSAKKLPGSTPSEEGPRMDGPKRKKATGDQQQQQFALKPTIMKKPTTSSSVMKNIKDQPIVNGQRRGYLMQKAMKTMKGGRR
ncbi:hypothetical protein L596_026508 [Steinernema carpocapsae]|uniref:Uncharacterized protein n=1 Tax=Steinernema carpocapsae TaxID=34508 RepID=A0A4U5M1L1_STECR|nr:hypothetical protein L596_026508 [Steinernema carpocapsae]